MAERPPSPQSSSPPPQDDGTPTVPPRDPRLEIPEILRTPISHPSRQPKPRQPGIAGLGELSKALAIGFDFLFAAAAGGFLGFLLDRWLGSAPIALLVGLAIGFLGGTIRLIHRTNKAAARPRSGPTRP